MLPYVSCFLNSEAGACLEEAFDFAYVLYVVDLKNPLSMADLLNKRLSSWLYPPKHIMATMAWVPAGKSSPQSAFATLVVTNGFCG